MSNSIWKNVSIAVESARGSALTISSITKATTPVLTYTGTDPSNGDYFLLLGIVGMVELEGTVVRVKNVNGAGNTFEFDGVIDSSAFGAAATGGSAYPISFGTALSKAVSVNSGGGQVEYIDQTTIHVNQRVEVAGLSSPIAWDFDCLWDPSDPGLAALYNAYASGASKCIRATFQNGYKFAFYGDISCGLVPGGSAQNNVTTPVGMRGLGRGIAYLT